MDNIFPKGIRFIPRTPQQPDFVKGKISIRVDEFISYLKDKENNGWVNLDILKSKSDKLYLKLNDFQPQRSGENEITKEDLGL